METKINQNEAYRKSREIILDIQMRIKNLINVDFY